MRARLRIAGWLGMLCGVALSGVAAADQTGDGERLANRPAIAPPGACAEPRRVADSRLGEPIAVAGPVTALFDPIDVAEGGLPEPVRPLAPTARPLMRPGACDQPGSGCSAIVGVTAGVVVPPVTPGVRPLGGKQ